LHAVVDRLRHLEEGLVATDDSPVGDQPQIVQQGHEGAQQLGDTSAVWRRIDVEDASAA
jgi:hypothetical protein